LEESLLATCFHAGFLLGLFFEPENGGDIPPKHRLPFNGIHGVISQKIMLFKKCFFVVSVQSLRVAENDYIKLLYSEVLP
jgi:hypothetical protein